MKFLVCRKQKNEGCDYTIGCGMVFEFLYADSKSDLIENIIYPDGRGENNSLDGDNELSDLLIIHCEYVDEIDLSIIK